MLQELNVPYTSVQVDLKKGEHLTPEFKKINPFSKLPALEDNGFTLFESGAIMTYLGDKYPERGLVPKAGTHERGTYDQWMYFCMSEMDAHAWAIVKNTFIFPEAKRTELAKELAAGEFRKAALVIEQTLEGKKYLLGDTFTAADIMVGQTLLWAGKYEVCRPFKMLDGLKNIEAYIARLKERPAMPEELRSV